MGGGVPRATGCFLRDFWMGVVPKVSSFRVDVETQT